MEWKYKLGDGEKTVEERMRKVRVEGVECKAMHVMEMKLTLEVAAGLCLLACLLVRRF